MDYNYEETYEFDLTGKVQFGDLSIDEVHELFRDGRVASKFIEKHVPLWFDKLVFVDKTGYDHIDSITDRKFDLKGFTKNGASYAPSTMLGAGRRIDKVKLHEHAISIDYIFSDITQFPKLKLRFVRGETLVETFPSGKIGSDQHSKIFG